LEGQVITGPILAVFGALAVGLSLLELASVFVQSSNVVWTLVRRVSGRSLAPMSQMQAAMFWIQVIGLLLGGCVFLYVGLNV
jgi:hypothetical protein